LSLLATALSLPCEYVETSIPLGTYCLNKPLVFSLVPRCQGFWATSALPVDRARVRGNRWPDGVRRRRPDDGARRCEVRRPDPEGI